MNLDRHLSATLSWLAAAQDARTEDRGVAAAYHLFRCWLPSYPETTGYIINTFLAYGRLVSDEVYAQRAVEAGEWLLSTQLPSGAFPGGYAAHDAKPRVFNTGMILFGLAELAELTNAPQFFEAGRRALDWLVASQDEDGSWTSVSPERQPHAYHSRVAWAIVEMARRLPAKTSGVYLHTAQRAGEWVLTRQDTDGWFRNNDLILGLPPITHNIAYVLRGLLELGVAVRRDDFVEAAQRGAEPLYQDWAEHGYLAAGYETGWRRGPTFRCVTGEAQLGLVWLRLAQLTDEARYRRAAEAVARQVAATQWMIPHPIMSPLYGGVPGAWPVWGRYLRFAYPNWAAKFFADLLMMLGVSSDG